MDVKLNPLYMMIHNYLLIYLPKERKYSPNTIRSYRKTLELLLDFVKEWLDMPLSGITFEIISRDVVVKFLDYLEQDRQCSIATRNQRLNCIRSFYSYAAMRDITVVPHMEGILTIKEAKSVETLVDHMSQTAVQAILQQPDTYTDIGKRDAFLMLFLYKTAARAQELVNVRLCDLQFGKHPSVVLHGKGAKCRSIPLREDVVTHLGNYLARFHPSASMHSLQHLFYVNRDKTSKQMTEDNVRRLVAKYGQQAHRSCKEVPERVYPHLFRHSWAMFMYQNGVDLSLISQWLGHSSVKTTLIYAHADTEIKKKAIEKAVPADSPLKVFLNAERYRVDDDELLKTLCGLK